MGPPKDFLVKPDESTDATVISSSSSSLTTEQDAPRPVSPIAKMNVRFNFAANEVFPTIHLYDYTQSEFDNTWYSDDEYDAIKKELIATVKLMNKGKKIRETNTETCRGLEIRTKHGYRIRQYNKRAAMEAVLDEQHRQAVLDIWDDDMMRDAYRHESSGCEYVAHARGLKDEAEILESLNKVRYEFGTSRGSDTKSSWQGIRGLLMQARLPGPVALSA